MLEFDLSDVLRACEEGQAQRVRAVRRMPFAAAEAGVADAKARHTYQDRTGNLTGSAHPRSIGHDASSAHAEMRWSAKYASFVDQGTKFHVIYPRLGASVAGPLRLGQKRGGRGQGRALLAFAIGGRLIFARSVRHPGTRPYGITVDACLAAQRTIERDAEQDAHELEEILSR